jgi:NAD(P)H-dependent FMN reductase
MARNRPFREREPFARGGRWPGFTDGANARMQRATKGDRNVTQAQRHRHLDAAGPQRPKIGKWMADFAKANSDFEVELVDLADFDLPLLDEPKHPTMQDYQHEHTKRWSAANAKADAFVFVSPEYDYFPAASTVNAIQALHKEWKKKPVGLVGYGGVSGGLRAMQTTKVLMTTGGMMPLPQEVPIPFVFNFIDEDGTGRRGQAGRRGGNAGRRSDANSGRISKGMALRLSG